MYISNNRLRAFRYRFWGSVQSFSGWQYYNGSSKKQYLQVKLLQLYCVFLCAFAIGCVTGGISSSTISVVAFIPFVLTSTLSLEQSGVCWLRDWWLCLVFSYTGIDIEVVS